mgnify:CR=1 FL=1
MYGHGQGHSHGQGHDTTFAQIVADKLGIGVEQVEIIHGDSDKTPFGMGSYGSRSLAVGGSAIAKAVDKVIDKAQLIAALHEAANKVDDKKPEAIPHTPKGEVVEQLRAARLPGEKM